MSSIVRGTANWGKSTAYLSLRRDLSRGTNQDDVQSTHDQENSHEPYQEKYYIALEPVFCFFTTGKLSPSSAVVGSADVPVLTFFIRFAPPRVRLDSGVGVDGPASASSAVVSTGVGIMLSGLRLCLSWVADEELGVELALKKKKKSTPYLGRFREAFPCPLVLSKYH